MTRRTRLPTRRLRSVGFVVIAVSIQIVGYAALLAVFPHSHVTPLVVEMQALPMIVLLVLAVLAVPAVLLGLGFGTAASVVLGIRPESVSAILLAEGDIFVFVGVTIIAVTSVMVARRTDVLS